MTYQPTNDKYTHPKENKIDNFHEFLGHLFIAHLFSSRPFLFMTDEYAVAYMEANQGDFTQSSVSNIVHKLRALAAGKIDEVGNFFVRNDPDGSGTVPYEQFKALILKLTNVSPLRTIQGLAHQAHQRKSLTINSRPCSSSSPT